jgi:hypothetical protein
MTGTAQAMRSAQHLSLSAALRQAMSQLNACWPRWWELTAADIRLGDRAIAGPLPEPWSPAAAVERSALENQTSLAALNPQPLPPAPREILLGVEIADRLIGTATFASRASSWLPGTPDAGHVAARLMAEVEELCPPLARVKVTLYPHPQPDPPPRPEEILLTPLAQLAMAARFDAAAQATQDANLRSAFAAAGQKLAHAGAREFEQSRGRPRLARAWAGSY